MASGLVAKKIALFELKPPNADPVSCRLKRKHAIRRKKYRRNRKLVSESGLSAAASEEHLDDSTLFYASSQVANSFSASCSALLDLIYNPEKSPKLIDPPPSLPPVMNMKEKRILCRTSSLEEAFPTRLNIIDIDIEIRVEKKNRAPSPDVYEPLEYSKSTNFSKDKLKLNSLLLDSNCNSRSGSSIGGTSASGGSSSNYYCTSCGNYNMHSDNLQEHIYENFSLIPPPRPPKRLFGDSLETNYSVDPIPNNSYSDKSANAKSKLATIMSSVNFGANEVNKVKEEISQKSNAEVDTTTKEEEDETNDDNNKEPYYEDLYDYCIPPDALCIDTIQPFGVTSFVNDKDDEVEYCDCSTVMAIAINNLNSGGTVIYNTDLNSTGDYMSVSATKISKEQFKTDLRNDENRGVDGVYDETKGVVKETTHIGIKPFLSALITGGDTNVGSSVRNVHHLSSESGIMRGDEYSHSPQTTTTPTNNLKTKTDHDNKIFPKIYGNNGNKNLTSPPLVTNDSKDKKDEDDLYKPLPNIPANSSSSSSSDSFYSEPIYGITNQITNTTSSSRNPGPPVPDSLIRPSLSPNPVISCNNIIRNPPTQQALIYKKHSPSIASGITNGSNTTYGDNIADYADSVSNINSSNVPQHQRQDSNFAPNDKLPPIPPSKFSSIAKSAGRRIAKKFLAIRKTSKSSLENYEVPSSSSSSTNGSISGYPSGKRLSTPSIKTVSGASTPTGSNGSNISNAPCPAPLRKPISRPSIPPPEPPKSVYGGSSNGSANNYSIYGKSDPNHRNQGCDDDDFDDSDFYDSDSELIRNFVSQVQPIYSMEEEPLYQYYAYGISIKPDDDYQPVIPKNLGLTLDMLVPRVGQRTLWCELSEVTASGILGILSDKQKQLQEAIFEILTSEVSYLKSLDVLIAVFYKNEELIGVLTEEERGFLFGNIEEIRECAQSFLAELLAKWDESWYIQEIGDIINRNAITRFCVYKEYCRNKPYQDKAIARLRHSRDEFVNVVKTLEEDSRCQMLRIDSFLMLPMQRITRLPLLVNAVIQRTISTKEKTHCDEALKNLTNLVLSCNEAARESQDAEETSAILDKLEFLRGSAKSPNSLGPFLMKADFMKNPFDQGRGNQLNWTFRKAKRTLYWLLLFTNQLLITKRKANGRFEVLDMAVPGESTIKPLPNLEGVANDFQHFFMLHFDKKETVYFLAARTNSEIERWKSKLDSLKTTKKLNVEAIFPYEARRADELSFFVGDVIEVTQMQPDGWYYGTKVNGGPSGWFPGNYCCEV